MSKLKQLIEAANRKCEMAWKVYSYNPEKDNELVDTSKAFDCIAAAQAHKRDILEKNPNYTVEIVAESMQKNEAKTIDDIRTADIAKYLKDNKKTDLKALKLKSKAFAKDLQNYFKLTSEPSVFDIDKVLDALPYFMQEAAQKSKSDLKYFTYTKDKLKTKADVDKALSDMKKALAEEPNFDAKKAIQKDMEIVKSWKSQMNEDTYKVVVRDVYGSNAIIKDAKDLSQAKRLKFDLTNKYKHSPVYIIKNGEVLNESTQSNVPDKLKYFVYTKDKLKTKEDFEKALKEMKKAYYEEPSGFEKNLIDQEMAIVKTWQKQKFESSQINESRNYVIIAKVSVPDTMNNRDVEDKVEELLDKAGLTVIDVEATRK